MKKYQKISAFPKHLPFLWGGFAAAMLLLFYFGLLSIINSYTHALDELARIWYWILLLVLGFGVQVGLFAYARLHIRRIRASGVVASGSVSGVSMAACCAHHLSEVLPLIGLTAVAGVLVQYQTYFIVFGILSNIAGIVMMIWMIRVHRLYSPKGILARMLHPNHGEAIKYGGAQ